jgi:hypothetical protein
VKSKCVKVCEKDGSYWGNDELWYGENKSDVCECKNGL